MLFEFLENLLLLFEGLIFRSIADVYSENLSVITKIYLYPLLFEKLDSEKSAKSMLQISLI